MPESQIKTGSRKLMFENAPKLFFVSFLFVAISAIISSLTFLLPGTINLEDIYSRLASGEMPSLSMIYLSFRPFGVVLAVLLYMIQPVIDAGFMSYCMKTHRTQNGEYKNVFDGFLYILKVLTIFIVSSILIFLWSLLFFFPGISAYYRYRQAYYILLDDPKKSALQCIAESKRIMRGKKLDLFILDLTFIGWYLLDIAVQLLIPTPFALPIVSIWLSPYIGLSRVAFYENQLINLAA